MSTDRTFDKLARLRPDIMHNVVLTSFVRVTIKDEEAARSLQPESIQLHDREELCKAVRERRDKLEHGRNEFPGMPSHGECRFVMGLRMPKYWSTVPVERLEKSELSR